MKPTKESVPNTQKPKRRKKYPTVKNKSRRPIYHTDAYDKIYSKEATSYPRSWGM